MFGFDVQPLEHQPRSQSGSWVKPQMFFLIQTPVKKSTTLLVARPVCVIHDAFGFWLSFVVKSFLENPGKQGSSPTPHPQHLYKRGQKGLLININPCK
jgi:hypothetical protein